MTVSQTLVFTRSRNIKANHEPDIKYTTTPFIHSRPPPYCEPPPYSWKKTAATATARRLPALPAVSIEPAPVASAGPAGAVAVPLKLGIVPLPAPVGAALADVTRVVGPAGAAGAAV